MNRQSRKEYLISKHIDDNGPIGQLPVTDADIIDEMTCNEFYREHRKTTEKPLTSDEK